MARWCKVRRDKASKGCLEIDLKNTFFLLFKIENCFRTEKIWWTNFLLKSLFESLLSKYNVFENKFEVFLDGFYKVF